MNRFSWGVDDIVFGEEQAEDEAKFNEADHPRGPDGKFTDGAGGGGGGGAPDKDAGTELKKEAPYGGLYVTAHGDNKAKNHDATISKVVKGPVQLGIHYRRMLATLLKEGPGFGTSPAELKIVKEKLADSWFQSAQKLEKAGKLEDAEKAYKKADELGYKSPVETIKASPKPAPTPAPAKAGPPQNYEEFKTQLKKAVSNADSETFNGLMKYNPEWAKMIKAEELGAVEMTGSPEPAPPKPAPIKTDFPPATEAELAKAKKNVALQPQYIPGDKPEIAGSPPHAAAMTLIQKFNELYAGKSLTDPAALQKKVNDFKVLTAGINALAKAEQANKAEATKAAQAKAQEEAAKKAAAAAAEAKKHAEQNKQIMADLGLNEQHAEGFNALAEMMGANPKTLAQNFKHYEAEAGSLGYPITGFQCALIKNYSNGGYTSVNAALRGHTWTPAQHMYASMVNQALQKMPRHKGKLYRNVQFSAEQIAKYKEGHVFQEDAFMSTSTNGAFGKGRNVQFQITSIGKRGADIKKLSNHPGENEVLFAAKTYFKVNKIEQGTGKTVIHIEEWDAPL